MKNASAIERAFGYREHLASCEIERTEFCTCGMKQAMEAARTELADLQSRPTKEDLEANVMSERATWEGYRQALMDRVIKAEKELAGYTEIGPCGKHPKMFWVEHCRTTASGLEMYCSLCREIEQAVERRVDELIAEVEHGGAESNQGQRLQNFIGKEVTEWNDVNLELKEKRIVEIETLKAEIERLLATNEVARRAQNEAQTKIEQAVEREVAGAYEAAANKIEPHHSRNHPFQSGQDYDLGFYDARKRDCT